MPKKADEKDVSQKVTLAQIACQMNKQCGVGTMSTGRQLVVDPPRVPMGVFAVDFATGGGLPLWATTCLWGPEGGGKSTLGINAMVTAQSLCWKCFLLREHCTCKGGPKLMDSSWLDVEGTFDRAWAEAIGVHPDRYVLTLADYGEQYANVAESVLRADDCGLVVIDSLASLVPSAEMDAAAEDQFMAKQAQLIGRMVRRLKQRLIRERKREHPCCVLFVNQMRKKLGVMFGDPETMSGGHGMLHEFSLLLRTVKKSLNKKGGDAKYVDAKRGKNIADRFSFSIRKHKVQTLAGIGEYVRMSEDSEELGLKKGQVDDFNTLMSYAKIYGVVTKDETKAGGWRYFQIKSDSLDKIKQLWRRSLAEKIRAQSEIVKRAKQRLMEAGPEASEALETEEE